MTLSRRTALWVAAAAAILAIAAIAITLALPRLVDPERLKRVARDKALAAWGRELAIGELSLALWPLPALHAERISLANPAWARSRLLFYAESVDARLELLPLVVGNVRVKGLDLDGVRLNLETGADGAKSWDLVPAGGAGAKSGRAEQGDLVNLRELTVRNAQVTQRVKGVVSTLMQIEHATGEAQPGLRDVRVEANAQRNRKYLAFTGEFADLSRLGREGATTEGKVDLDWGKTHLALAGRLPIDAGLKGYAITADLKASSIQDMLAYFGDNRLPTAPVTAHLTARETQGRTEVDAILVTFGKHAFAGAGSISQAGAKTIVNARLDSRHLDWEKALLELGYPALPPLAPDELFYDNALAWPLLASLDATAGTIDLRLGDLDLRNGVEIKNVKARIAFAGDRLDVNPFSIEVLGGSATGNMQLEGRKKAVRLNFDGTNILLERWFHERGKKVAFTGGPMRVKATLTATGESMKALAASITGPVTIRMGPGVWASEKAAHAEDVMASAFSGKNSATIDFECAGASLPFVSGRASSRALFGARSAVSNLLTSGFVDLREQTLDLRGRVKPRTATVGLAAFAGDIKITGKLRAIHASLDPVGTPGAIARGAAAIATLGLSAMGSAAAGAEQARKDDPCDLVFR